jgi:hypothetical protein
MIRALGSAERRCSFAKPGAFVMVGGLLECALRTGSRPRISIESHPLSKSRANFGMEVSNQSTQFSRAINARVNKLYNATANETRPEAALQRGLSPYSCPAFSAYRAAGATQAPTSTTAQA